MLVVLNIEFMLNTLPSRAAMLLLAALSLAAAADRRASFNESWKFFKGDAPGAEQPAFADAAWRSLNLPHDWAIEGPFDPKYDPHTGGLPFFGTGWYRKHFTPAGDSREGPLFRDRVRRRHVQFARSG